MPTARELLEQADALMRRNRKRGKGRGDIPTLSAALDADGTLAPTVILAEAVAASPIALDANDAASDAAPGEPSGALVPANEDPISLDTLADVPVLTDIVVPGRFVAEPPPQAPDGGAGVGAARVEDLDVDAEPSVVAAVERAGLADENAFPTSAAAAAAVAAHSAAPAVIEQASAAVEPAAASAVVPPAEAPREATPRAIVLDDDFILEIPPVDQAPRAAAVQESPIPAVAPPPEHRDWDSLAEEIRMQVLQRLDLLTDAGLHEQLGARLRPIVDRASGELVATINRELGELVRGYVAEAIEREIESWRSREK
jgi:hypothetical protein